MFPTKRLRITLLAAAAVGLSTANATGASLAVAPDAALISVSEDGLNLPGNAITPFLSADGTRVAFSSSSKLTSTATAPLSGYGNHAVFLFDTSTGTYIWNSVNDDPGTTSRARDMSADGNLVLFDSDEDEVGDGNGAGLFLRNVADAQTERVSIDLGGSPPTRYASDGGADLSADGRFVVFGGYLFLGDGNGGSEATWVRDRLQGTTVRLPLRGDEATISDDGVFVALNIAPGPVVFDMTTQSIIAASSGLTPITGNGFGPMMSPDGSLVLFTAYVPVDPMNESHVYALDVATNTVSEVTPSQDATLSAYANGGFSPDGRYYSFFSEIPLLLGDTPGANVYLADRQTGSIRLVDTGSFSPGPLYSRSSLGGVNSQTLSYTLATLDLTGPQGIESDIFQRDASTPPPLVCDGRLPTITGTAGDDTIRGTQGPDVILGLEGDDTIAGRGGNDVICGGPGADDLSGDQGSDRLFGGADNDQVDGGPGPAVDVCVVQIPPDVAVRCEDLVSP